MISSLSSRSKSLSSLLLLPKVGDGLPGAATTAPPPPSWLPIGGGGDGGSKGYGASAGGGGIVVVVVVVRVDPSFFWKLVDTGLDSDSGTSCPGSTAAPVGATGALTGLKERCSE